MEISEFKAILNSRDETLHLLVEMGEKAESYMNVVMNVVQPMGGKLCRRHEERGETGGWDDVCGVGNTIILKIN